MPSLKNFYDCNNGVKSVFVIACLIAAVVAVHESLLWYIKDCLSVTDDVIQYSWGSVYHFFNKNGFLLFVVATQLFGMAVFVIFNLFFAILDLTGKPNFLMKYKVQEEKAIPVSWLKYKKCLRRVTFNVTVIGTLFQLVFWPVWNWRGVKYGLELPTLPYIVAHIILYILVEEVMFYYLHRLFHNRYLYKLIHKTHHEWTAPVGISASYCHPLEHFIVNILPIATGPMLLGGYMGNHLISEWVWLTAAILSTTISHSGYHIPFLPSPEHHDFHHSKFNYMFGVIGVLDYIHGTDALFRQSKGYHRHFLLLGWASAKDIIPDST